MKTVLTRTAEETKKLGRALGRKTKAGEVLLLAGPLGSGKTTFMQGFAAGAGYKGAVVSPTFGLVREYRMKSKTIYHLDLFRLADKDLANLGLEEYLSDPKGICVIEWPAVAAPFLPSAASMISFDHAPQGRRITL